MKPFGRPEALPQACVVPRRPPAHRAGRASPAPASPRYAVSRLLPTRLRPSPSHGCFGPCPSRRGLPPSSGSRPPDGLRGCPPQNPRLTAVIRPVGSLAPARAANACAAYASSTPCLPSVVRHGSAIAEPRGDTVPSDSPASHAGRVMLLGIVPRHPLCYVNFVH